MADNVPITPGTGRNVASDQATYSGDTADVQLARDVETTGSEGSKTVQPLDKRVVDTDKARRVVVIGDPTSTDVAAVDGASGGLAVKLVAHSLTPPHFAVKLVDSGGDEVATLPVSGPLTDTQLRATAVPVSGTVTANAGTGTQAVSLATLPALVAGSAAIGKLAANSGVDIGDVDVTSSALPTGASTSAKQDTQITAEQAIQTAVELIDDTVAVLGTATYTEATTKGTTVGAVRRDADTTLVNTTNEIGPLQMDANGRLKVEAFSGETLPVSLASTTVTGTVAVTQSGTWDEVGINDSGNSITVDGTFWQATQPVSIATAPALVASSANIGDVDVLTIAAGDNNIGNVDIVTMPNVTIGTMAALVAGSAAIGKLAANSGVDIGDVDVTSLPASTNTLEVVGDVAQDAAIAGNPMSIGLRASTVVPTAMSADGDSVYAWANRSGAQVITAAPHVGLNSDPWNLVHEAAQYTGTQTSAALVTGGASEKLVVTKVQIQVGGTTAGTLQLYFGTGAFSRGTNRAIFDGEFAPSATLKPGVIMDGPFIAGTNGDDLLVTTSAAINPLTINVWFYVIT